MTEYLFTDIHEAGRFYFEQNMKGVAATMETVVPCKQWRVCVYA